MPDRSKLDHPTPAMTDNHLNNNDNNDGRPLIVESVTGGVHRRISEGDRLIPVEVIRTFTNDLRIEVDEDDDGHDGNDNGTNNASDGNRHPNGILMLQEDVNDVDTIGTNRADGDGGRGFGHGLRRSQRLNSNRSDDELSCDGTMTPSDGQISSDLQTPEDEIGPNMTNSGTSTATVGSEATIVSKSTSSESSFSANGLHESSRGDVYDFDADGRITAYVDFNDWYKALAIAQRDGRIISFD